MNILSQVFSSPSRRCCWASTSPLVLLWGSSLAPVPLSALEPSSGGFPVGGLVAPCAVFLVGCGVCLWDLQPLSRSIPPSRWGPALLFPVAPAQSILPALSWALGGLPGSLLCLPPGSGSSSFHGSLWFWHGASAPFYAGPTLGLSSAPWLFHRILPPVSLVLSLLNSSLLCSLASWLIVGSAFQVLVETGPSSSAGVTSSASSSCLRGPLGFLLLLSTLGLPLVSVS